MSVKTFDNLIPDIHALLHSGGMTGSFSMEIDTAHSIVDFAKRVSVHTLHMLDSRPTVAKKKHDQVIRGSEVGTPCIRQLMFKWYVPEYGLPPYSESHHPTLPIKFTFGDYIEELTLFLAKEAGHTVSHRQKEVELPGPDGWRIVGHIDAEIDGVIVDVKSAADVSFNKYKRESLHAHNDSFGYRYQLDTYALGMVNAKRAFLFVNKHDGEILKIDRSFEPYEDVAGKVTKIVEAASLHDLGVLPDRLGAAPFAERSVFMGDKLPTVCSYCNFKYHCYDGDVQSVIKGGRPIHFIKSTLSKEGKEFVKKNTEITPPEAYKV